MGGTEPPKREMTTMTTTTAPYRAAIVGELRLTGPEHADWAEDELRAEAQAEARRANLGDDVEIRIGVWTPIPGQDY